LHGHGAFAAQEIPVAERLSVRVNRVGVGAFAPVYRFWWYHVHQVEGAV
jgi:hypothetical protein